MQDESRTARTRWVSVLRSMVMIWETLITDGFVSPDSDFPTRTFPGASASARLDVTTVTTTVAMRLSLNGFDWTMRTACATTDRIPAGVGKEAHQISPRFMLQDLFLRLGERIIETGWLRRIDGVELGCHGNGSPGAQIRGKSIGIELASESLSCRARCSPASNTGSGIDIATFTPAWYHQSMTTSNVPPSQFGAIAESGISACITVFPSDFSPAWVQQAFHPGNQSHGSQ